MLGLYFGPLNIDAIFIYLEWIVVSKLWSVT